MGWARIVPGNSTDIVDSDQVSSNSRVLTEVVSANAQEEADDLSCGSDGTSVQQDSTQRFLCNLVEA